MKAFLNPWRLAIALLCVGGGGSGSPVAGGEARETAVIRGLAAVHSLAFSPDGKLLAAGGSDFYQGQPTDGLVKLLEYPGMREVGSIRIPAARPDGAASTVEVYGLEFFPDGQILIMAGGGVVKLWDVAEGKEIATNTKAPWGVLLLPAEDRAEGPAGKGIHQDGAAVGEETGKGSTSTVGFVLEPFTFSEDKALKLSANALEYLPRQGQPIKWIAWGRNIAISPDARLLGFLRSNFTIGLWDTTNGRHVADAETDVGPQHSVDFAANGKTIAVVGEQGARIAQVRRETESTHLVFGPQLQNQPGGGGVARFSPDGSLLAILCRYTVNDIRLWEVSTGRWIRTLRCQRSSAGADGDLEVTALAFSPDGKVIAVGGVGRQDKTMAVGGALRFWDMAEIARPQSQGEIDAEAKQIAQELLAAIAVRDSRTATSAAYGLGPHSAAAVPVLLESLGGPGREDRIVAVGMALIQIGPGANAAVPAMIDALKDKERIVRLVAVGVLGAIGTGASAAVPPLMKVLEDPDALVRAKARKALHAIDPKGFPR